jgi:hypothetical protein
VEYAQLLHDASEVMVRERSDELNIGGGHKARVADNAWEFVLPVLKPSVVLPVIEVVLKGQKGSSMYCVKGESEKTGTTANCRRTGLYGPVRLQSQQF